jgi:hypothetical protein
MSGSTRALRWFAGILVTLLLVAAWTPGQASAEQVQYVIDISVDGLGSSYLKALVDTNQAPNFKRLLTDGAWTYNARDDYDVTVTLPNHVTMATGRGIQGTTGHNWTSNVDPSATDTIHKTKGSYVASGFDVAHDNGLRTAMYATKTKFSLFNQSYDATNGALDGTGPDNGRDKLDVYYYNSSSTTMTTSFVNAMKSNPYNYSFLHYTDPDSAGHGSGWGSTAYNNSLKAVDARLGQIFSLVETDATLKGKTTILLTADHGGEGTDHSNATRPLIYTIPFGAWGTNVLPGGDLYAMNAGVVLDPGTGRPTYGSPNQPIRNGSMANLTLDLLGLGAIPGSTINSSQMLAVPEPTGVVFLVTLAVPAVLICGLRRLRRRV